MRGFRPAITIPCPVCSSLFVTYAGGRKICGLACRIREIAGAFQLGDECWNWPKSHNPQTGYGQLSHWKDGKRTLHTAHRESYKAFNGPITGRLMVLHKCDNRSCFNPAHLFLGTQVDNMQDMISKGRQGSADWMVGELHHRSKLTEEKVRFIRSSGLGIKELSDKLGISRSAIFAAKTGRTWRHVDHSLAAMSSDAIL